MALSTIEQFYPTYTEAVEVIADLTAAGIPPTSINVIDSETDARLPREVTADTAQSPALTGGTLGAAIGGGIGALVGIGAISIPLTDPLVATGWVLPCVVFAIIGAIIGAIVGTVIKLGISNKQAHSLASGLQKGQHLVMVQVEDFDAAMVQSIFARPRPVSPSIAQARPQPETVQEQSETTYREVP